MEYKPRTLEPLVSEALKTFPAVLITGGRQAGKTTFLKHLLPHTPYVTLDSFADLEAIKADFPLFFSRHPAPLILDEIQYAPECLRFIKVLIDEQRRKMGQFALTGSQIFPLMKGVSESLAGRVAIFTLYPLSWQELQPTQPTLNQTLSQMVRGFYPELQINPELNASRWFDSFLMTYIERDVRNIRAQLQIATFQKFLRLLAARSGQLLNHSELAKELGISQPTVRDWIEILEATFVIHLLRPYYANVSKRFVKSPKVYFTDTGLLCFLLGIETPEQLERSPFLGHVFENMVIMEAIKRLAAQNRRALPYFYRTTKGVEIDLLIESGGEFESYEIKWTQSPSKSQTAALQEFCLEHPIKRAALLCPLDHPLPLTPQIDAIHWYTAIS